MALESIGLGGILTFSETKAVAAMGRASKAFSGLQKKAAGVSKGVETFSRGARNAGLALAPLAIGFGFAVKKASDFEKAVAEVTTIADEAEFPIRKIEKATLDMAVQFGTAPVEQVKALYQAISAGATTAEEATALLTVANELAVGGLTDVFTATDVLTTATNAYAAAGLTARDASDSLFVAIKAGKTTADELSRSLGAVIPTASKLGIGFGELNAAVAAITLTGIVTAEATTGLNAALANVLKPSKEARETAKKLGIEFNVAALKSKGLAGFMGDVIKATSGNEEAMTKLFGSVRGVRAVMALATNDAEKFEEILAAMEKRGGATKAAFDKMSKTFDFQMRRLSALKDVGFISLGKILKPLVATGLQPVTKAVEAIVKALKAVATGNIEDLTGRTRDLAEGIQEGMDTIQRAVAVIKATFIAVGEQFNTTFGETNFKTIGKWATIFLVVGAALSPILIAAAGVGFAITTILIPAISGLTKTMKLLSAPLLKVVTLLWGFSIPVFVAVAAIAILAGGLFILKKENESLSETVARTWNDIVSFYSGASKSVNDFFLDMHKTIVTSLIDPLRDYAGTLASVMRFIPGLTGTSALLAAVAAGPRGVKVAKRPKAEAPRKFVTTEKLAGKSPLDRLMGLPDQISEKVGGIAEGIQESVTAAQKAAEASEKAAKKKPCAKVEIDGREVGKAVAKNQDEVKTRSGFKATPWQRRQAIEHGAIT